jgi:predicted  nucleic acid-binding Zn-ribbon protein
MTELEKLYALQNKATHRMEAAQLNITTRQQQISQLESDIRNYQGELSMAEYFLECVNQFIEELENGE